MEKVRRKILADKIREASFSSKNILGLEAAGMVLSYGEMFYADSMGLLLIGTGCVAGVESTLGGCVAGAKLAWEVDKILASKTPLGEMENLLDGLSFLLSLYSDSANTYLSDLNELFIGTDSLVAGRNFVFGLIPEANLEVHPHDQHH